MQRILISFGVVSGILLLGVTMVSACGDKLLGIGRGVRYQRMLAASRPASILAYARPNSDILAMLKDRDLETTLKQAGHKLRTVGDSQELDEALKTGQFDIVLTDLADAPALEQPVQSAPSKPVLLPVVNNGAKAQAATAEKHYSCILKAPGKAVHYLAAVEKAMELKLKRDGSKLVASRNTV